MSKKEKAMDLFKQGYNCSQAVLLAFAIGLILGGTAIIFISFGIIPVQINSQTQHQCHHRVNRAPFFHKNASDHHFDTLDYTILTFFLSDSILLNMQ